MQCIQFCTKNALSFRSDAVGLAALFGREGLDQQLLFEPGDGPIESSRSKTGSAEQNDVFDHRVPVFGAARKTGEDQQRRIRILTLLHVYYV